MPSFIDAIERESSRFLDAVRNVSPATRVPSCPDWNVADLTWHLAGVQYFWSEIVGRVLEDPSGVVSLERPPDEELPQLFEEVSGRLIRSVQQRDESDSCWNWSGSDLTVGWVRRRQAHEALIHRVDAELAAASPTSLDPQLAADGIDEMLTIMLDASDLPQWATFDGDGSSARIELVDQSQAWDLEMGRFTGTSPRTGTAYDDPAARLLAVPTTPGVVISGSAGALDLWLWGRGSIEDLTLVGDRSIATRLREASAEATQ